MKARPLVFSRAKKEPWQEECYRAYVSVLTMNTEQAYFEVSKNTDSVLYYPSFWYGNSGGHMEHTRHCGNKEEAMKLCQEEFDRLVSENIEDIIALIPKDYVKTRAGIGGDLNICEYCNRPYDSCRCNEVYNKALADVRKIFDGLNHSKQTWYQDKHDEALRKQTEVDTNVGGEYKPELDIHWEEPR